MTFSLEKRTPAVCLQPQRMMRRCESAAAVVLGRRLRRVCVLSAGGDVHCEAVFQGDAA